ncbi:hypothetical protein ABFU82_22565 [Nocardioides sp. WV_118_6]
MPPIVSADQLCVALEDTLKTHLVATMATLGYVDDDYDRIKTWQQVPTLAALTTAQLPGIAIASPGLVAPPSYSAASGTYTATWRLAVGIYVRGRDHADTQARTRNWCAGIRLTALGHKSLGGVAKRTTWTGEEYADRPGRETARTLAGGVVALNVTADLIADPTAGNLPPVTSTPTSVSVQ